jgi:hypothetical protein
MKKKSYIIVGDNNFWYATTGEITEKELKTELKNVQTKIIQNEYSDFENGDPSELIAYEAKQAHTLKF